MKPAKNAKVARTLAKMGYRWHGIKREQQKRGVVVICALAAPSYDPDKPDLAVCSTSEDAAVNGLLAAVSEVAA